MSYEKTTWSNGDVITEQKLNKLENGLSNGEMSTEAKQALLECFQNVAWVNENGQDYYDALELALFNASLVSITATFNQASEQFYEDEPLDHLKQLLTVVANYDNGIERVVTDYEMSGSLEVGTSTITVSYEDKETSFDVTVTDDFYNRYKVAYPDDGLSIRVGNQSYDANNAQIKTNSANTNRAIFVTAQGKTPYWGNAESSFLSVYPIPVPKDATQFAISTDENVWCSVSLFQWANNSYPNRIRDFGNVGYGGGTISFDAAENTFIGIVSGLRSGDDFTEETYPSNVTVEFS